MALINCPECGKEISDKAEACPNCGCPINSSRIKNKYMVYMVGYRDTDTAVSAGLKEVCTNLYLLLLWQHLKGKKYSVAELSSCTVTYCAEPDFRAMLAPDVQLGSFEQKLFLRIENEEFRELHREILKSKWITNTKRAVKKMMRAVGMKR